MKVLVSESLLSEATSKYVKKVIDPALMTWQEFHDNIINPQDEWHESTAYSRNNNYEYAKQNSLSADGYMNIKKYPILVNTITVNGRRFQVRKKQTKRHYYLTDERGERITDQEGRFIEMNDVERKAMRFPEFYYEVAIFDQDGVMVSSAENEWGALLVTTVDEFKGWGFGKIVLAEYRKGMPEADSGGFTNAGYNLTQNYYFGLVRDYLAKGFYSYLIKKGHISKEKVKTIIAQLPERSKSKKELDLNFNDPKDILVIDLDNGEFILYNKKIIPLLIKEKDPNNHFVREGLLGHIRPLYMDHVGAYRLQLFFARNKKIEVALNLLLASYLHDDNIPIIVDDVHKMFEQHIDKSLYNIKKDKAYSKSSHIQYKPLNRVEQKTRLEMCGGDKHEAEDLYTIITELAYMLSED